ncbi:hypothetical protein KDA11_03060 [Candidatus Saccharibacteria bacterium]|nr:hypothetical protein [Candidatus Saccharibacteria bacterium]
MSTKHSDKPHPKENNNSNADITINKLQKLEDFRRVLNKYQMSKEASKLLSSTPLVVLVSITAAGRNTIINQLIKTKDYHYVVSDTTRYPRKNNGVMEQNGVEYWFRKEEDMLKDLQKGLFLEAAIIHDQQVSGISLRELQVASDLQKIAITEIEIQGSQNILQNNPDSILPLFIIPPSYQAWIRRWETRGEVSLQEKRRRTQSAVSELTIALNTDKYYFIINDNLNKTVQMVNDHIKGKIDKSGNAQGRKIAADILKEIKQST